MSILEDLQRFPLSEFNGAKPLVDPIDLAPGDALVSLNSRFSPGKVRTREGFAVYAQDSANNNALNSPFYWSKGAAGNPVEYLTYLRYDGTNDIIQITNLSGGAVTSILTLAHPVVGVADYAIFAPAGDRLYANLIQFAASYASPTGLPYAWDGNTSHQMISCFQRPMKATEVTEVLTQPAAGVITAGTHYVGVLFQTLSGYWTKPGPTDANLVLASQSIVSTGTNNIRVTLTPASTWPTWIKAVQVILTTATNSFEYFLVPGTITTVTAGSATVYAIDISISDLQLTSIGSQGAGTLATDYFGLLSMNASNAQPFNVRAVLSWGQRTVWFVNYGGVDCFFPSDPLNPEWISADQHIVQMPGGKPFGSAFVLRGVLYVVSSAGGVFAYVDNGGRPTTFSPPSEVDGSISVPGFFCTSTSSTGGYALIASPQGLYSFSGGSIAQLPLSYEQTPEWELIPWNNAAFSFGFTLKDFPQERILFFQAATSTFTQAIFTWTYSRGMKPEALQYSKWTNQGGGFTMNGPSIEIVRNASVWELFLIVNYSPHAAIMRLQSVKAGDSVASTYTDFLGFAFAAAGIDWQYQTAPLPSHANDSPMLQHLALRFRATALTGTPAIYFSAKSLDDARTITMLRSPVTLSTAPGKEYVALYDAQEERVSYLFTNNAIAGAGISLARLTHFFDFMAEQR